MVKSSSNVSHINKKPAGGPKKSRGSSRKNNGSRATTGDDAIALIKQDHKKVEKLLEQLAKARATHRKMELFSKVEMEILVHARLEEEIFYPAFLDEAAKRKEERMLVFESREEHDAVERLLAVMHESDMDSEQFEAQAMLLKEQVTHHAKEEEEKKMLPLAKKKLDKEHLEELGQEMQERRPELESQGADRLRRVQLPVRRSDRAQKTQH